jgi:mannose-6-phosphate isomerase-like protein (cupin superfamily)
VSHFFTNAPDAEGREFALGQVVFVRILTTGPETEGRHDLIHAYQPPGSMTPLHTHTRYEERLWVLSGSMTVWSGAAKVILKSGDFLTVALNVPHAIQAGSEGSQALVISSPAGFGELIARAGTPAHLVTPDTEIDQDRFMEVATELGDILLGPPGSLPTDLDENGRLRTPPNPPGSDR